jgi:gamma-glutamylcyclotransferase (GGCT)/AIG2-like uncharacterized protein YtfP
MFLSTAPCAKGEERDINRLRPAPRWIGRASIAGVMHHLGSYPGLVLGGQGTVHGEVYAIDAELERVLDEIEEVWPQQTGEYAKREVAVWLDAQQPPAQRVMQPVNWCACSTKSPLNARRENPSSLVVTGLQHRSNCET